MVVNVGRFTQLPCLFKPLIFLVLFVNFILYAACYWVSAWSWFSVVIQIVVVIFLIVGLVLEYDSRMMNMWLFLEMIVSGAFAIFNALSIILQLRWLIVWKHTLFGIQGIMVVILTTLYALNGLMIFKIWRNMGGPSATTTTTTMPAGGGIQPGNPGAMHPGFGATPAPPPRPQPPPGPGATYPGGSPYASAIPPGSTFPTSGQPTNYSTGTTNYGT